MEMPITSIRSVLSSTLKPLTLTACLAVSSTATADDMSLKSIYHDAVGSKITDSAGEDSLFSALLDGTPTLQLQLGYEVSDLDNGPSDDGEGLHLRTRLAYKTKSYKDFQVFVQWQHLNAFVDDYSRPGGRSGKAGHDAIADTDGERIHQAYIDFTGISDTKIRYGIQEVILDDARLIGNIGWRPQAQSFLGVSVENKSVENLTLKGAYLTKVQNIHKETRDLDGLILLNGKYVFADEFSLTAFGYLDDKVGTSDSATYGATAAGTIEGFTYSLTGAQQTDYEDSTDRDGTMINAALSTKVGTVKVGGGYSYISGGSNAGDRFSTLYGTAHAFNGWADTFLATNDGVKGNSGIEGGLQNYYVHAGTKFGNLTVAAFYHRYYTADDMANGFDGYYGQELNVVAKYPVCKNVTALLKYALYDEGDDSAINPTADEQIVWARLMVNF